MIKDVRRPWLIPESWSNDSLDSVSVDLQEAGVLMHEDIMMHTYYYRWPEEEGVDCSFCGAVDDHYSVEDSQICGILEISSKYKCKVCRKRFSITSRTFLDDSKLPLEYWWRTAYLLGDLNIPVNSHWLAKDLILTQKTTHWMLMRIAVALGLKQSSPLKTDMGTHDIMFKLLEIRKRRS